MRTGKTIVAAALLLAPGAAQAQKLKVVEVGAPAINCVFHADCRVTVSDSVGTIALPLIATPGTAWLQSRTYTGEAGTPGAGKTAFVYRVSMVQASGSGCVSGLVLNFGPVTPLPYKDGALADVFVVTSGGLGTIGLASAEKTDDVIVFEFATSLCVEGAASDKNTTFFFGLAAAAAPMKITGTVFAPGDPPLIQVEARVPTHTVPPGGGPEL
jgi:hypothetical protein